MEELTEEKSESKSEKTFESMNISVGEIFPPKKISSFFPSKNIVKLIIFILISLLIISLIIIF